MLEILAIKSDRRQWRTRYPVSVSHKTRNDAQIIAHDGRYLLILGGTMTRSHRYSSVCMLTAVLVIAVSASAAQAQKGKGPNYGLWVLNTFFISEFQGNALVKGGVRGPRVLFGVRDLNAPVGIAWDNEQNLWLSFQDPSRGEIVRLTPRQVQALASGQGVKDVVLLQDSKSYYPFNDPTNIGFDKEGDLWVVDGAISSLMKFTPDQIVVSGAPTPAVWIRAGLFVEPSRMRFDSSDNLWVEWPKIGQVSGVDELVRFSPQDRTASGPPNPSLILDIPTSFGVNDFAFDGKGNLWIANVTATSPFETIVELIMVPEDQIAGSGELPLSPAITIVLPEFAQRPCVDDVSIDFDPFGALWVSGSPGETDCNQFEQVDKFTPEQLISSGNATSAVRLRPNRRETNFRGPRIRVGPPIP